MKSTQASAVSRQGWMEEVSPRACCSGETALGAVKINVCATWYEQVLVFNPGVIFSLELLDVELWRGFAVET